MKVFIDLYAGLGGASEAFMSDPNWLCVRIDNNPDLIPVCERLIISDILNVHGTQQIIDSYLLEHDIEELVIWASPPCQQYSFANPNRDPDNFDNACLLAAMEYIEYYKPTTWIIENVKGAIEEFNDIIGDPWRQRVSAFFMWGKFSLLSFRDYSDTEHSKLDAKGSRKLRPNYRAKLPLKISEALKDSLEHQRTLFDDLW